MLSAILACFLAASYFTGVIKTESGIVSGFEISYPRSVRNCFKLTVLFLETL